MDTSIRSLLLSAKSCKGADKTSFVRKAFTQIRTVVENRPAVDAPEPFGQDLFVQCAEIAFEHGLKEIARDCLKMFFLKQQATNQFLIRAYLCQAQLLAPPDANKPDELDKAVVYILKAISMAVKTERYHFLVYNASVTYWQFCRPFVKPNFRKYLAHSLHQVVKALDDTNDKDFEWRAQLIIALIECHLDAGQKADAANIATAGAAFIKLNVPHLYKQIFGLTVRHQLIEVSKLQKEVKASPELAIYYMICKLKSSLDRQEPRDYQMDIVNILTKMGIAVSAAALPSPKEQSTQKDIKGTPGRSTSPAVSDRGGSGRSSSRESRTPPPSTPLKRLEDDSIDKPELLMELAHLCLNLNLANLASICVEHIKKCNVKEPSFYLEMEFLACLLMVKRLGENQESYQKSVVDLRLQAIKRCEEAIMNAVRQSNPNLIQAGCVVQWNLCLPLLQPNLRECIHKSLILIAEALEDINSLLLRLRCQLHTEVAKCEEDREQIQVAMEHLRKALALDDGGVYQERLEVMLRRLELRAQLYRQPERPEDQAAMIIEQARKADSGSVLMKRSLLVKAGEALAPDAFLLVLDSENDTKDEGSIKGPLTFSKKLCAKARSFNYHVQKAEGHLKRLGNENDRERARLWADLAKTARRQEVWDVCRAAARFCLLYDDGRWKKAATDPNMPETNDRSKAEAKEKADDDPDKKPGSRAGSRQLTPVGSTLYEQDLVRMLAEVNFINGEAIVQLLRAEGVQLNDTPVFPEDQSKKPKGHVAIKPEEDSYWVEYCAWIKELSDASTTSFLRGLELGVELNEPWLVCSAAAYIWNYNNHVLTQMRHREILSSLNTALDGLKKVGHAGETIMLVNISNGLAIALIQPWIPENPKEEKDQNSPSFKEDMSKSKMKPTVSQTKVKATGLSVNPDGLADIKKAIEVCEFAMNLTSGDRPKDVVPIGTQKLILQTWVTSKQMAQQQISKTFGTEDDSSTEGQKPMIRAIVATEMLMLNKNGIMEFKDVPSIADVAQMVESCQWTDPFIKLELYTRLTSLAHENHQHSLVMRCSKAALQCLAHGSKHRRKKEDKHQHMVGQDLLAYVSLLQGQSLVDHMAGKDSMRREAMQAFVSSACFASSAGNYDLVMAAAQHYWNACVDFVGQPTQRQLLKEPIKIILDCITSTYNQKSKREEPIKEGPSSEELNKGDGSKKEEMKVETKESLSSRTLPPSLKSKPADDLALRAAMYSVLFHSYADQSEWELGLKAMDQAIADMPRTNHRLLIFKHRVLMKAKLGHNIDMDFQKFKDESEDCVAQMWRRVALCSKELSKQLSSYQNAIEALSSPNTEFLKVDYLLEFGQWLYYNHFPLQDVLDQVEWAIDILLNMQDKEALQANKSEVKVGSDAKKFSRGSKIADKKKSKDSPQSKTSASSMTKAAVAEELSKKASGGGAVQALDGRSEFSDQETESRAAELIPVAKEIIIGVLPNNPDLRISDLTNVKQLDALVQAHVLLADLTGPHGACYADLLLQAQAYLVRLWKVVMSKAGPAMKILQSPQMETTAKGKTPSKGSKGKESKPGTPVKEKPKRKGLLDALPELTEDWAVYDAPDELIEAFHHESMKKTGLNEDTFPKPMLSMYYLESLVKQLRDIGFSHLALPVLAFQDLLSRSVLKNHSLKLLVHARALETCLELDLKAGCEFHENIIGNATISEKEQFRSREQIASWKEKQAQVTREKMRARDASASIAGQSGSQAKSDAAKLLKHTQSSRKARSEEKPTASHIGKVLGAVSQREVWVDVAEVLIRLGYLQKAREYLSEANLSAVAFSDASLQGRIMYLLGKLAFEEAQFGQAINFCEAAQQGVHQGDEMFWFETMTLLVDSVLHDYSNKNRQDLAKKLLSHAISEFMQITNLRPNRAATLNFFITTFEAKLATVELQIALDQHKDVNVPAAMKSVLSACEKLDVCVDKLIRLGHRREAVALTLEHGSYLAMLARAATEVQVQHAYYLEALSVLKEAESVAEQVFFYVQTLASLQETRNLSLPVQRELANLYAHHGELLVEVAAIQAKEMRLTQLAKQRKSSVLHVVEDYIRHTPVYTPTQQDWLRNRDTVFDEALTALITVYHTAGSMTELKTRALAGLGSCLRILAEHKGPDPPRLWLVHEMEQLKLKADAEEAERVAAELKKVTDTKDDESSVDKQGRIERFSDDETRLFAKNSQLIRSMTRKHEESKLYFTYATDCLTQGLNLALANKHKALAGQIALELVKCCGQFDPPFATQFLALYQSCQASLRLHELLYATQKDPTLSALAALLQQRHTLLHNNLSTNLAKSSMMATILKSLENDWQAWKRLEILPNHLEISKEFPANFTFIILQHSPDRDFLYAAVLDKAKQTSGLGGGKTNPRNSGSSRIFGVETDPQVLQKMTEKFRQHKRDVQTILLKQEFQRTQSAQRQKMLENIDGDKKVLDRGPAEGTGGGSQKLEEEFQELLTEMEDYLGPIMAGVDTALRSMFGHTSKATIGTDSKETRSTECVVLLADSDLLELPLEALSCLKLDDITAVTRDFSLQVLYHRMFQGNVFEGAPPKEDAGVDKKKKESPQVPSRIVGATDSKVKQNKQVVTKRTPQPWQVPIETTNIKYIVDPNQDCADSEERKPVEHFRQVVEEYESLTQRWLGICGEDHTPSVGEWEIYIKESSSFLFFGCEHLAAYLPPVKLSALNIPDCMLMYVLDLAQTSRSFMRQSKMDTIKSQADLALEGSLETAMLITMTGAKCLMANQWFCPLAENTDKLKATMKDLLDQGLTTGQAVWLLVQPRRRRALEEAKSAPPPQIPKSKTESGNKLKNSPREGKGKKSDSPRMAEVATEDPDKDRESPKSREEEVLQPQRSWFNMVCYGMPNLVIT